GEITLIAPVTSVATQMLPALSTPSESNNCMPGKPHNTAPVAPAGLRSTSPGAVTFHAYNRPVCVSAAYSTEPSGERPMPFGALLGKIPSVIDEPSGCA